MENVEIYFGAAVRQLRQRKKLSQEAMASVAGIHRTYASSIERGRVQVSIGVAVQIADALEVSLSRLFREVEKLAEEDVD